MFLVAICPFFPKINIVAYIFQTIRLILLIFCIETYLMVFFEKIEVYSPGKNIAMPIFGSFLIQICPFLALNQHFSLCLISDSLNLDDFCIETILMFLFWKIEVYSPEKIYPCPFFGLFSSPR